MRLIQVRCKAPEAAKISNKTTNKMTKKTTNKTTNKISSRKLTPVSALGEFGLIDRLTAKLRVGHPETVRGVGDDTAVLDFGKYYTLVTKDLLIEDIHFDIVYTPLRHLGYKAITVNLSDIYAMNGEPLQVLVGLAVSSKYSVEGLDELYSGMAYACERYGVDLAGGDTTLCPSGMMLSITVVGRVEKDRVVYRGGASENELICVSGDLGAAYMGLLVLEREKHVFKVNPGMQPDLGRYAYVLERQLKPEAGRHTIQKLSDAGVLPTSMIDISDGLASEVLHLCRHAQRGAVIYEEKIPVNREMATVAHEFGIDPSTAALNGGEDYELLFTIKPSHYEKIKEVEGITPIGHMTGSNEKAVLITTSGQQVEITAQGWDSFRTEGLRD